MKRSIKHAVSVELVRAWHIRAPAAFKPPFYRAWIREQRVCGNRKNPLDA